MFLKNLYYLYLYGHKEIGLFNLLSGYKMTNMINPPDITTYYIPEDQRSNNINLQNHIHEITKELCIPL